MSKFYLISDNHFSEYDGPKDVISIFNRPFKNSAEMNRIMIENWNGVVRPEDTVFSLGDFAWTAAEMKKYARLLNGNKYFILGNHDFEGDRTFYMEENYDNAVFPLMSVLTFKNKDFLLVHRPEDVPYWWNGWVIHGHHHWMLPKFPFIDGKSRNINVSCELIDYTPIDIDWILSLSIESVKRMDTAKAPPIRW